MSGLQRMDNAPLRRPPDHHGLRRCGVAALSLPAHGVAHGVGALDDATALRAAVLRELRERGCAGAAQNVMRL
jgi:hypothetical protein